MIIGIGGISRAGKGTLADLIAARYLSEGCTVGLVHQDTYIVDTVKIPKVRNILDWECPESLDFDAFRKAIESSAAKADIVLAEGLMCFYDKVINRMFDARFLIEITWTTFLRRKRNDYRWGAKPDPYWYLEHIWESYYKYGLPDRDMPFVRLSGDTYFDMGYVMSILSAEKKIN